MGNKVEKLSNLKKTRKSRIKCLICLEQSDPLLHLPEPMLQGADPRLISNIMSINLHNWHHLNPCDIRNISSYISIIIELHVMASSVVWTLSNLGLILEQTTNLIEVQIISMKCAQMHKRWGQAHWRAPMGSRTWHPGRSMHLQFKRSSVDRGPYGPRHRYPAFCQLCGDAWRHEIAYLAWQQSCSAGLSV